MTQYEIVPGSIRHVRPMSRRMNAAGALALGGFDFDPRLALHRAFMQSLYCRTAIMDDKPVAMWGAVGTILGDSVYVWLVLSPIVRQMPRAVIREAGAEMGRVMVGYPRIFATVVPGDTQAVRFAQFLGFGAERDGDDVMAEERYRIPLGDQYVVRMTWKGPL